MSDSDLFGEFDEQFEEYQVKKKAKVNPTNTVEKPRIQVS